MWVPDRSRVLKIRLHNQGEDRETLWAEDLGPALLHSRARYVRIANVPVFHLKPTYGDVIEVFPDEYGMPEWDRHDVEFDDMDARILEDSGRWVAIIDYWPSRTNSDVESAFRALNDAGASRDIAIEGVILEKRRGCAYLAVPGSMSVADVVAWLHSLKRSLGFELRHPGT